MKISLSATPITKSHPKEQYDPLSPESGQHEEYFSYREDCLPQRLPFRCGRPGCFALTYSSILPANSGKYRDVKLSKPYWEHHCLFRRGRRSCFALTTSSILPRSCQHHCRYRQVKLSNLHREHHSFREFSHSYVRPFATVS